MSERTVSIIGAGMAGLSAGCYLRMNGFDTTIFELHKVPGGLCTGWKREGYTFDGCIHWLVGSNPESPIRSYWDELIDMSAIDFVQHDEMVTIELRCQRNQRGERLFHFYSDIDRLERYMLSIAPEDRAAIDQFIGAARRIKRSGFPPMTAHPKPLYTLSDWLELATIIPMLPFLRSWGTMTNIDFARRLKSPILREAFEDIFEGEAFPMIVLSMQQAWFDQRDAGYPIGGSLAFAKRFADRYQALGGELRYGSRVKRIIVEGDRAVGVELIDGEVHRSDEVISAADGHFTIFEALGGRYTTEALRDLYGGRKLKLFPSLVLISFGLTKKFDDLPTIYRVALDEPLSLRDGTEVRNLDLHTYHRDPTIAPEDKTVMNVMLMTRAFDDWHQLRQTDREAYKARKKALADEVIERLDARFEGFRESVEVVDVATPATIHRYTNNWQGSFEGWLPSDNIMEAGELPMTLPGLERFHMIGQWISPGGGLPPALMSGRQVAQLLCHRDGRPFTVPRPSWQPPITEERGLLKALRQRLLGVSTSSLSGAFSKIQGQILAASERLAGR